MKNFQKSFGNFGLHFGLIVIIKKLRSKFSTTTYIPSIKSVYPYFGIWLLLCGLFLSGCKQSETTVPIASLWNVAANADGTLNFDSAYSYIQEEREGFKMRLKQITNFQFTETAYYEGKTSEERYQLVRDLARTKHTAIVVGANTNDATMESASITDFYEIPMLIPFAKGDNLISDASDWSFEPATTAADFSKFIAENLVSADVYDKVAAELYGSEPVVPFIINCAILYEDSQFGEEAAVDMANILMNSNIVNLEMYEKLDERFINSSTYIDREWANGSLSKIDIFFIISEAVNLTSSAQRFLNQINEAESNPLLIFFGNVRPKDFLMEDLTGRHYFAIHKMLNFDHCPAEITTNYLASGYAAASLIDQVVTAALAKMPKRNFFDRLFAINIDQEEWINELRPLIRDELINFSGQVDCYGSVSFDSEGKMVGTKLQFMEMDTNTLSFTPADMDRMSSLLAERVKNR